MLDIQCMIAERLDKQKQCIFQEMMIAYWINCTPYLCEQRRGWLRGNRTSQEDTSERPTPDEDHSAPLCRLVGIASGW
jgi:hypothetical protein